MVSLVIFSATEFLPGDAASVLLGQQATPSSLENLRRKMGLDRHPVVRYMDWIGGAVRGDLGVSPRSGVSITSMIKRGLPNSALLAVAAFLVAVPASVAAGVVVGVRPDTKLDRILSQGSLLTISLPEFVTGVLLMLLFASTLGWLPSSSIMLPGESIWSRPEVLVLPILTITGALFAYIMRMARANVIEVMNSPYVRTAILKGLPMRKVVIRHVLPNAMLPTITVIANNVGWMFGGLIIVESVFAYPGVGRLLLMAINTRDVRLLQSTALVIASVYAFSNLAADLLYGILNPRIRLA
ncbi:MAG: ABC transporter permease [Chloroflexi bacterium]|nr:ABC transporter permease [Chloroflexota bacterium]